MLRRKSISRQTRATLRDSWILFREFQWSLLAFVLTIVGGGILYFKLAVLAGEPVDNLIASVYQVLAITFLNPVGDFPKTWFLEIFYFVMPLLGIVILAQGVADFGIMFFNRRSRRKEWEMAVVSTYKDHIILVGLGHLGYRVAANLASLDEEVVAIEHNPSIQLVENVRKLGVPVIQDDGSRQIALENAGVARARSIILCTQNDSLNLQIAVKARSLNPGIQVVIRIFDDDFAQALQEQFGYIAMSATGMAAPAFAASAAGVEITRPITVEGHSLSLARLEIKAGSDLEGLDIGQVEKRFDISVVLLRQEGADDFHPTPVRQVHLGDVLVILGRPSELNAIIFANTNRK